METLVATATRPPDPHRRAGRLAVVLDQLLPLDPTRRPCADTVEDQPLIAVHAYRSADTGPEGPPRTAPADKARQLNDTTFAATLGGHPTDVTVRMEVRPGPPGRVLRDVADHPDDLIVIGGSGPRRWTGGRRAAVARSCSRAAVCPVVIVPPPPLARTASEARLARDAARGLRALLDSVGAPSAARHRVVTGAERGTFDPGHGAGSEVPNRAVARPCRRRRRGRGLEGVR